MLNLNIYFFLYISNKHSLKIITTVQVVYISEIFNSIRKAFLYFCCAASLKSMDENFTRFFFILKFTIVFYFLIIFLQIRCMSRIHDIWNEFTEKMIDEDRPQVLLTSVSSVGPSVNFIHSPYDQSLLDTNDLTDNYMTHTQGKRK